MRLIAIRVLILAGAVMAAGGTLAESLPDVKRQNSPEEFCLVLTGFGLLLFAVEILRWPPQIAAALGRKTMDDHVE